MVGLDPREIRPRPVAKGALPKVRVGAMLFAAKIGIALAVFKLNNLHSLFSND
jgi:hypothetical protein